MSATRRRYRKKACLKKKKRTMKRLKKIYGGGEEDRKFTYNVSIMENTKRQELLENINNSIESLNTISEKSDQINTVIGILENNKSILNKYINDYNNKQKNYDSTRNIH